MSGKRSETTAEEKNTIPTNSRVRNCHVNKFTNNSAVAITFRVIPDPLSWVRSARSVRTVVRTRGKKIPRNNQCTINESSKEKFLARAVCGTSYIRFAGGTRVVGNRDA